MRLCGPRLTRRVPASLRRRRLVSRSSASWVRRFSRGGLFCYDGTEARISSVAARFVAARAGRSPGRTVGPATDRVERPQMAATGRAVIWLDRQRMSPCGRKKVTCSAQKAHLRTYVRARIWRMDRASLEQFLAQGLSLAEIGRRFDLHEATVSYWGKKHGLEAAHRKRHIARGGIAREELEARVEAGRSIAEIDEALGCSKARVRAG